MEFGYTPWFDKKSVFTTGRKFDVQKLHDAIAVQKMRPTMPKAMDPQVASMVQSCWDASADNRPTMPEVLAALKPIIAELHAQGLD